MVCFLVPLAAAILIIGVSTAVLIRRDRRRLEAGSETVRLEAAATLGLREARRRARAYGNRFLRERE